MASVGAWSYQSEGDIVADSDVNSRPKPCRCPKCNVLCEDQKRLELHQQKFGHFLCSNGKSKGLLLDRCKRSFYDPLALFNHLREEHPTDQNIVCPGCHKTFKRAGGWMQHIQQRQCGSIFPEDIAQQREQSANWTAELKKHSQGQVTSSSVDPRELSSISQVWVTSDTWADHAPPTAEAGGDEDETAALAFDLQRPYTEPDANKAYFRPEDFPKTKVQEYRDGRSKQPDLLTGDAESIIEQKPGNAWAQKKPLFRSYNAVPPPPQLQPNYREPSPPARRTGERIIDPFDPDFNVAVFTDPILDSFKCPHRGCNTKPKNGYALIDHLKSQAHAKGSMMCPSCKNIFKSETAWVQHTETTMKCKIRESPDYRPALAQATAGILDIDTRLKLDNNTTKFVIDKKAIDSLRNPTSGPMTGLEMQESKRKQEEAKKVQNYQWARGEPSW